VNTTSLSKLGAALLCAAALAGPARAADQPPSLAVLPPSGAEELMGKPAALELLQSLRAVSGNALAKKQLSVAKGEAGEAFGPCDDGCAAAAAKRLGVPFAVASTVDIKPDGSAFVVHLRLVDQAAQQAAAVDIDGEQGKPLRRAYGLKAGKLLAKVLDAAAASPASPGATSALDPPPAALAPPTRPTAAPPPAASGSSELAPPPSAGKPAPVQVAAAPPPAAPPTPAPPPAPEPKAAEPKPLEPPPAAAAAEQEARVAAFTAVGEALAKPVADDEKKVAAMATLSKEFGPAALEEALRVLPAPLKDRAEKLSRCGGTGASAGAACLQLSNLAWEQTPRDPITALRYAKKSCALVGGGGAGCERAKRIEKSVEYSSAQFEVDCAGGNAAACSTLANAYLTASNLADRPRSVVPLRQACLGGVAADCAKLARLLQEGKLATRDDAEADRLFQLACVGGDEAGCTAFVEAQRRASLADAAAAEVRARGSRPERLRAWGTRAIVLGVLGGVVAGGALGAGFDLNNKLKAGQSCSVPLVNCGPAPAAKDLVDTANLGKTSNSVAKIAGITAGSLLLLGILLHLFNLEDAPPAGGSK
jgi:TPR repeat protein